LGAEAAGTLSRWAYYPNARASVASSSFNSETDIILMPPTDVGTTLRIYGQFYSPPLLENEDTNYWSAAHPTVLILATLRELEGTNRNSEGYKDFSMQINERLFGIDMDLAGQDATGELEMEG